MANEGRIVRQAIADGELHTTKPVNRALLTLLDENKRLRALVAIADTMYAEHAAEVQKASDAQYQAEFGHDGPHIAAALGSAGREYVYERHQVSKDFPDMPEAATALGQLAYRRRT